MQEYFELNNSILEIKNNISENLFLKISEVQEKSTRNRLLKLRRNIYQMKSVDVKSLDAFLQIEEIEKIKILYKKQGNLEKFLEKFESNFNEETKIIRNKFKNQIQNYDFQKGLLISSKVLYDAQSYYKNSNSYSLNRKQEQIERGLLRYYSRMVMKATPFGTFCSIIPGSIVENRNNGFSNKNGFSFTTAPIKKESIILINKGLYGSVLSYITSNENIKVKLELELNQTIKIENENLKYLTAFDKKEIFQKLENNEVLDLFQNEFEKTGTLVYEELISLMCVHPELEATKEEAIGYVDKLIEIGFLRFKVGIPEQQVDWVEPLINILNKVDDENAKKIIHLFTELNKKINQFQDALLEERAELLNEMDFLVKSTFEELEIKSDLIADLPFYEDSTTQSSVLLNELAINEIDNLLVKFISATRKLAYPRTEQASMRKFFDDHYEGDLSIPLLDFYEDFYREHFKEHLEKQRKIQSNIKDDELKNYNTSNPFNLDVIKKIQEGHNKIQKLIVEKWNNNPNENINLTCEEIKDIISDVPEISLKSNSSSLFSQIVISEDDKSNKLILPSGKYLLGYGKYFSRFLRLFPDKEQNLLFEKNNTLSTCILAEISGDDNFNANLHPPLTEYEISYPTSEVGMANKQLKCTDIVVGKNPDDEFSLILKDIRNNKEIIPLDLGFLNPMMRPPLFQLLSKFTPPSNYSMHIPERKIIHQNKTNNNEDGKNEKIKTENEDVKNEEIKEKIVENKIDEKKPEIIFRPRVTLEDKIILSRRCWIIPKVLFPNMESTDSNFNYFLKVNNWIIENKIPAEVYVKIKPLPLPQNKKLEFQKKMKKQMRLQKLILKINNQN